MMFVSAGRNSNLRLEEAESEELKIKSYLKQHGIVKDLSLEIANLTIKNCKKYNTDLVQMSAHCSCCEICNKLQGRVYSLSGNSKIFPKLPEVILKTGKVHDGCITRFKALIRWGYNNDYVSDISWLDKIQPLKDNERKERLEKKYLESDELKILLESMTVTKWRYLAQLTALSGLRIGEAIALLDSDVDCENRIIRVTKSHDPNTNITGYPKTSTSYRDVYMQDELYTLCQHIRIAMKQEQLACGYRTDLFLSDVNGNYLAYYAYNKYLKELAHRVLDKKIKITTHVMRHTHVALLAEQGVSLDAISRRLGHSDSQITRDIYFHVTKKMQERENLQLKKIRIL